MPTNFFGGQISILASFSLLIAQFRGQTKLSLEKIRGQTLNMEKIRGQALNLEKIRGQIVLHIMLVKSSSCLSSSKVS
jgi:hypothetical protein